MADRSLVDVGPVKLAYRVSGHVDAPPMVLLHGLTSDGSSWDPVAPAFARDWRVYVPDLRGHGRSDWPGTYSFPLLSADVRGFLDALHLEPATLVGHSMGGVAAYLLAQDHPSRVEALVLEETPPPLPQRRPVPERPDGPLSFDWEVRPAIVGQVNAPDPAWWDRLAAITAPTLVMGGGPQSPFPQTGIEAMAERIPAGRMTTIPAGHGIHAARPDEFAAAVRAFLGGPTRD